MAESLFHLNKALADRYRIERELGAGGMATVYLARDVKHQRRVAIKVLCPELAAAIGTDRFLREITTTANLHHPHILALYDSGKAVVPPLDPETGTGGEVFLYYVMPYVEGETLRERLNREKQLPLDDALQIAREVADALSYAHSRGVIHRDIKPENILLESGHALVADFGIARAVDAAGGDRLTETGLSIGTPTYMSPEQAAGDRDLDGRSDLYSLACVLYEMLAGQPPFTGPTADAVVRQHLTLDAPPVNNLRPAVSPAVAAALQRALAKTPADRFNPVAQFADVLSAAPRPASGVAAPASPELREVSARRARSPWLAGLAAAVLIGAIGFAGWAFLRDRGRGDRIERLAVLPLANLMADSGQDYFVEGMHDELISQLGRVRDLTVLSRTSVLRFRGSDQSIGDIARALDVDALVEGSIFRSGDSVRITAQLIQARPEKHLWSASYDGALGEALGLQRRVAQAIADAISATLIGSGPGPSPVQHVDPAAQEAYLRGRYHLRTRTLDGMDRAVEYLERAIQIQPDFAEAYGGLAEAEVLRTAYRTPEWSPDQIRVGSRRARDAALRALDLDSTQAGALSTLAILDATTQDWKGAEAKLRHAAQLNPSYPQAWNWLGDVLDAVGRSNEAVEARLRAQRLDPFAPVMNRDVGLSLMAAGRCEEALPYFRTALDIQPDVALGSRLLITCFVQLERYSDAGQEEERVLRRLGADNEVVRHFQETLAGRGWPVALSWLLDLTTRELPEATGDPRTNVLAIPGLGRANALAYLGRTGEALDVLERTLADPSSAGFWAVDLNADPWLRSLRGQPRYTALLRKYRLEP